MKKHFCFITLTGLMTGLIYPVVSQSDTYPKVSISDTEVRTIRSTFVKEMEYHIQVALPPDYKQSNQVYPVVYYTDAFYWGGMVIETYRLLRAFNEIPPLILVGISWNPDDKDGYSHRTRDYTPTTVTPEKLSDQLKPFAAVSGGADNFLSFIEKELIPTIEYNYRVDTSDRGIFGYSRGGLFNAYVLFNKPHLFQKYLLGAPTLDWDNYYVFKENENLVKANNKLPIKIFSAVGSDDFADILKSWIVLRDHLNASENKKLNFKYMILDGENHTSAIPAVYSRAFRVLYGRN